MLKKRMFMGVILIASIASSALALDMKNRYILKSGIIEYKVSGQQEGSETLYFTNHGQKEARYTNTQMSIFGSKQEFNSVNIIDGEWSYNLNLKTNEATKINYKEFMDSMSKQYGSQQNQYFSEEMLAAMGGKKIKTEKILGKTCDVYEMSDFGSKTWVYKGMPLKYEMNMMGMVFKSEAVKIQENPSIDSKKFELPKDVKIVEMKVKPQDMPSQEQMQEMQAVMKQFKGMKLNMPTESMDIPEDEYPVEDDVDAESYQNAQDAAMEEIKKEGMKKALGGVLKSLF
ncbi:MAG: hypothetical protein H6755_07900 [Candidatus Omnitrophica bacterium]|nr:hypothetical protein [Candidatus Omnitrophota bacterium]MCB9748315.1 hypothetical protein [Candidatus Omnitrophota bacterium]